MQIIMKSYEISKATVSNIVKTYADGSIKSVIAINCNPNSNAHRKTNNRTETEIIMIACVLTPEGFKNINILNSC